ncbi:FtsX-like permease family protein [Terrimonas pollutisoli]|uniref:FtsX-like permease family protein n=1 Tax=Terrimonas pollutisoli TaxID=3034147 RepID=UPI0023EAD5DA|nr:FtsX-like permease family protein [Terrimonas sp. H1YJ31]
MNFLFAWRYFKAKKSINAINIIARISIAAIVIGTAALILVLSVFNGFEGLVKSLYSSFYTDLKVLPATGKTINVTTEQLQRLKGVIGIKNYSLVAEEKALIQNGDFQSVMYLKGVDDNYRYVTGVANHIIKGEYQLGTEDAPQVILGGGVEGALGIQADRNIFVLKVYLPRKSNTEQIDPLNDISNDSIRTSSAFMIQQDFDNKYGITNIDFVKKALKLGANEYSGVEISLVDPSKADDIKKGVEKIFGNGYLVQTIYQQNQSLYAVMNLERWVIYGVLCLILVVAAFNMIGALTMLVLEKQKDISVLHALGANKTFIQKIFLNEGLLLALMGTAVGMLLALVIALLQIKFHLIPLQGGSFLIDYFPVKLRLMDFILVTVTVFVIALIASWLPSRKAASQEFSLRSE